MPNEPKKYLVKEIFGPTVQGEGVHAGRACVFLRFAVCNLQCTWCDTDFDAEGSMKLGAFEIARALRVRDKADTKLVIVTGGEPALQWDQELRDALSASGFEVHMESNGTRALEAPVEWLTVSPKPQFHSKSLSLAPQLEPQEIKIVVDESVNAELLAAHEARYRCAYRTLQPCWGPAYEESVARIKALLRERPSWRLGLQLHKAMGLP